MSILCGRSTTFRWRYEICWGKCGIENSVIVSHQGNPYYPTEFVCTNCGDGWCNEGMGERPFGDRYWRHKAIARAVEMFDRACRCPVERDDDLYPLPCEHVDQP
jgi:hypothetical protein